MGKSADLKTLLIRKMKHVRTDRSVHPSLGRRGIVVPYDIPKQEKCNCEGRLLQGETFVVSRLAFP